MTAERAVKILGDAAFKPKIVGETHTVDPKKEILDEIGTALDGVQVPSGRLMVAVYMRPTKTAGGIIRPDKNLDEDKYQGKIGLVVKMGPLCFQDDDNHNWGGVSAKLGDWVQFRVGDTVPFRLGQSSEARHYRYVEDVNILAIWDRPDLVY